MAESPAAPGPPEIETERGVRIDDIPVAETELEPPYRLLIHNKVVTNPIQSCGILDVATTINTQADW